MRDLLKSFNAWLAPLVPGSLVTRMFGRFCPVFVLHRIAPVGSAYVRSLTHVEACLTYMRKHRYMPLSLKDLAGYLASQRPVPERSVVFTIDDGFRDQIEHAAPLFARYDTPLTCFVITDFLDGELWPWDDQVPYILTRTRNTKFSLTLPDGSPYAVDLRNSPASSTALHLRERLKTLPQDGLYGWITEFYQVAEVERPSRPPAGMEPMDWADARAFVAAGHTIAPHSCSHRILSRLSDSESQMEITRSIKRVADELGSPPLVFAYPTGRLQDFTTREQGFLAEAGVSCAVSTHPRTARPADDIRALPRFSLPSTLQDFAQCLSFVEAMKHRVRSAG